jgi:hypothetical protein
MNWRWEDFGDWWTYTALLIAGMPEDPPPPAQSAQRDSSTSPATSPASKRIRNPNIVFPLEIGNFSLSRALFCALMGWMLKPAASIFSAEYAPTPIEA